MLRGLVQSFMWQTVNRTMLHKGDCTWYCLQMNLSSAIFECDDYTSCIFLSLGSIHKLRHTLRGAEEVDEV